MIEHSLLFSRYVGNRGPNLRSRDFKLTNECVYPSFSFLLTTAKKSKGSRLNYFFIHKLKPKYSSISKTVKIKGCVVANKFLARASEHKSSRAAEQQSNRVTEQQSNRVTETEQQRNSVTAQQSNRATEQQTTKHQSIRAPRETQALTQITLHQFCKKQRVIQDTAYGLNLIYKI